MSRLGAIDASFLYLETPTQHANVVGVLVVDPGTDDVHRFAARLCGVISDRIDSAPLLTHRLSTSAFGLDHPTWEPDPTFSIVNHVSVQSLPAPGTLSALATLAGIHAAKKLDRHRPLWEMAVVEGAGDGNIGVIFKVHHAVADGVTLSHILAQFADLESPSDPAPEPAHHTGTSDAGMAKRGLADLAKRSGRAISGVLRTVGLELTEPPTGSLPLVARPSPLDGPVSPDRAAAFATTPFPPLRAAAHAMGVSFNDLLLTGVTGALRHVLGEAHRLDAPLVCSVPVATAEPAGPRNRVSNMRVELPVQLAGPRAQVAAVALSTTAAKARHQALGNRFLSDLSELTPPTLVRAAAHVLRDELGGPSLPPVHNLVVSNVAGPRTPMRIAGARLLSCFPLGPLVGGGGLNVTVLTVADTLNLGVLACPHAVADSNALAWAIVDSLHVLQALAIERPTEPTPWSGPPEVVIDLRDHFQPLPPSRRPRTGRRASTTDVTASVSTGGPEST